MTLGSGTSRRRSPRRHGPALRQEFTMRRKKWLLTALLGLPLAAAGIAYGQALVRADEAGKGGFVCPLTGETLPCPACCPANR